MKKLSIETETGLGKNGALLEKVALGIVLDEPQNRLILQRRLKSRDGLLYFPGGKIEEKEYPMAALRRELKEEMRLTEYRIIKYLFDSIWDDGKGNGFLLSVYLYLIENSLQIENMEPDKHELVAIAPDKAGEDNGLLHPHDRKILLSVLPEIKSVRDSYR